MSTTQTPRDSRDVAEAIASAAASRGAIEVVGGGGKLDVGQPDRDTIRLSMRNLDRVIDYDPAELVITLEPGVLLGDVEALLASRNQMLAFEPWDFALLSGGQPGQGTIGGLVASGLAGSRRLSAGGVRDHLLGFTAVNGQGEIVKSGGRVVKNVTGYDLSKLMAGSWGRLGAIVELSLKVLPRPRERRTLALRGLSPQQAVVAMGEAMRAPADVAAAAHVETPTGGLTLLRLEGFGPSIAARSDLLRRRLADGALEEVPSEFAEAHWRAIQSASYLANDRDRPSLWRISLPPAAGGQLWMRLRETGAEVCLDWAGGLAWARSSAQAAASIRAVAGGLEGRAMLLKGPADLRRTTAAFHPDKPAVATLSERVRRAFDRAGVFSPDRFSGGGG